METSDFHHEAIGRLCFICGQIILKNGHDIDENLKLNIAEMFSTEIELKNNVTPSNVCHACWRTVKHFFKNKAEGKYFNTSKKLSEWAIHSDDCLTCELYRQNQKGINSFQYFDANSMLVSFITNQLFRHLLSFIDVKLMSNFSYLGKRKKKKANVYLGKSGVYWNIFSIPKSNQDNTFLSDIDLEVLGNINTNLPTCICYFCQKIINRPLLLKCCNRGCCYGCFQSFVKGKEVSGTECPSCKSAIGEDGITVSALLETVIDGLR